MRQMFRASVCAAMMLSIGCGSAAVVGRIGHPVALPTGDPQNGCERWQWYELVPARVQPIAVSGAHSEVEGFGVFAVDSNEPQVLEDLWTEMHEPALQQAHQARIEPVDQAFRESMYWSLGGSAGLLASLGGAAALQNNEPAVIILLSTGLVIGVVGIVGAIASLPTTEDQLAAEARRTLLIPNEDDMTAASRGVSRLNHAQRNVCGANTQ